MTAFGCSRSFQMMKALTIRRVDEELARKLEEEMRQRGTSLNETVLQLLRRAVGLDGEGPLGNGLARHAGTWSEEDLRAFQEATTAFDEVDEELWR